eukprot:TRINITY_DN36614_c0_g1_i2.p1 TRINITY_DN36614_c0_g1~~TRINITY_DN36614_c0_g1_i2.p1  ORF type:complete len:268 (+),score=42.13 TRINITY_DN36614_c0_g1_i2:63-806(+)
MHRYKVNYLVDEPSRVSEENVRAKGIDILQQVGVVCDLPRGTIYKAGVLLHRFFWCRGVELKDACYGIEEAALAALLLASKLDDREQTVFNIINCWNCIEGSSSFSTDNVLFVDDPKYAAKRSAVVTAERHLLTDVGFNIEVEDPYKFVVFYTKEVLLEEHALIQSSWTYLSDSLLTDACCHHPPHHLALGALFLSLRKHNRRYPDSWWESFSITTTELIHVVKQMARCYVIAKSLKEISTSRWSTP